MEILEKIIRIIEENSAEGYNETVEVVSDFKFNKVAKEIVKLFTETNIINWINIKEEQPFNGQKCWVVNKNKDMYLATYCRQSLFTKKLSFNNMLGKGWTISNIIKWQPLISPSI